MIATLSEVNGGVYRTKEVDLSKYRRIIVEDRYVVSPYNTVVARSEMPINRFINECTGNESRLAAGGAYIYAVNSDLIALYQAESGHQTYVYGQLK